MKTFSIAIIAFAFTFLKTSAQEQKVPVGVQPAEIIRVGDDLHVFCSGWDANGNGIVETGDVEASWWIFDAATMNVKRSKVLEGGFLKEAPLSVAVSYGSIFIFHENKIKRFNLSTQEFKNIIELPDSLRNIVVIGSDQYAIEAPADSKYFEIVITSKVRNTFMTYWFTHIDTTEGMSFIHGSDLNDEDQPIQFEFYFTGIHLLTRGIPGKANSKLLVPINPIVNYTTVLGKEANFMTDSDSEAKPYSIIYVVMYGDHAITLLMIPMVIF